MNPNVTIVLVNYNAQSYMEDFFDSVWKQDYDNLNVLLVDNASNDSSIEWLKEKQKNVCILELPENVGFGEGCNIGIKAAEEKGTEYVLLLNIDTVLESNLVSELVKYADENTVTTAMTYCGTASEGKRLWYAGGNIDFETANVRQTLYENPGRDSYDVDFVSGCCMLIHLKIVQKVGYFDKDYYLYYEDTDYCTRMKAASVNMKYLTTTSLWHKVGGSSVGGSEMSCSTQYYVTRNRLLFSEKNAEQFHNGNLCVLRQIMDERAYFDGKENAKYKLYIECAIADYLKKKYGRGYYGDILINNRYYIAAGFYEHERNEKNSWYWANRKSSKIYIVNPKRANAIYNISFDLALPKDAKGTGIIEIFSDGKNMGQYQLPCHIEFTEVVGCEDIVDIDLTFHGEAVINVIEDNERRLFYQLLDLEVNEVNEEYYLDNSFYQPEGDGDIWNWSPFDENLIYLVNKKSCPQIRLLNLIIEAYETESIYEVELWKDNQKIFFGIIPCNISIPLCLGGNETGVIKIKTGVPVCLDGERDICFKVRNVQVSDIQENVYWETGFLPEEREKLQCWHWCRYGEGTICIINNTEFSKMQYASFKIEPFMDGDERENENLILVNDLPAVGIKDEKKYNVFLEMMPYSMAVLKLQTKYLIGREGEAGRNLCFKVSDFVCSDVEKNITFMGPEFYTQETDGINSWSWSHESEAEILFASMNASKCKISFWLDCETAYTGETVKLKLGDSFIGNYSYREPIIIEIDNTDKKYHNLQIAVEHPSYKVEGDQRRFAFKIVNFRLDGIDEG